MEWGSRFSSNSFCLTFFSFLPYVERTIGDLPLLQPYYLFFPVFCSHWIYRGFFRFLSSTLAVVFLSIGSLYRKRLAFRNFVLFTFLFTIVPTGKGTGRNSYTICTGARWQFIHVSNINSIAIKSDSME